MRILKKDIRDVISPAIIIHVVNDENVMGAGVAKSLYEKWPEVKRDYHAAFEDATPVSPVQLGDVLVTEIQDSPGLYLLSLVAQRGYAKETSLEGKQCFLDYGALEKCISNVVRFQTSKQCSVYLPFFMGCGLAGGNWDKVAKLVSYDNWYACKLSK